LGERVVLVEQFDLNPKLHITTALAAGAAQNIAVLLVLLAANAAQFNPLTEAAGYTAGDLFDLDLPCAA